MPYCTRFQRKDYVWHHLEVEERKRMKGIEVVLFLPWVTVIANLLSPPDLIDFCHHTTAIRRHAQETVEYTVKTNTFQMAVRTYCL